MKSISILKHNLMRAAMTLALIVTCATAWAQTTETVSYIDADGDTQTVSATVLTGSETSLDAGWYVAKGTLNFDHCLRLSNGDVTLILADGCSMNVGTSTSRIDDDAFSGFSGQTHYSLDIYGQTLGTGALSVYSTGDYHDAVRFKAITINGGNVTADTEGKLGKGICAVNGGAVTINGGNVNATATGENVGSGIYADNDVAINGGTITATGTSYGINANYGNGTIILGWTRATDHIYASSYKGTVSVAPGLAFLNDDNPAQQVSGTVTDLSLINGKTLTPDVSSSFSVSADGNTYTIWNAYGWSVFCDLIDEGTTFSGKTVKLGKDITVTRMAGIYNATTNDGHAFSGAFNGQNYTLTFTCTAANDYVAPFAYLSGTSAAHASISDLNVVTNITATDYRHIAGLVALHKGNVDVTNCHAVVNLNATVGDTNPSDLYPAGLVSQTDSSGRLTISNCTTTGTIATDGKYAAGLVGVVQGTATIEDCVSSVTINSSTNGDGTHGGLVAVTQTNSTTTIEGCLFNGKLLTANTGETATGNCGGILGWKNATVTIKNTLYAPAALVDEEHEVVAGTGTGSNLSGTFYRGNMPTLTNCYYTRTLHNAQGKQAHSITAGQYVTVANAGTLVKVYNTSGITIYGTGIKYNDVLYASNGDAVSLTLGNNPPEGYVFNGYTVSPTEATLTGTENPYTLTMPTDADVEIGAEFELLPVSVTYLDENGQQQTHDALPLLGGGATTLAAGWYVVNSDISYTGTVTLTGDVTLILADNCHMNIGSDSDEGRIDGYGIFGHDNGGYKPLTITSQSLGDNMGTLNVYTKNDVIFASDLTINGGNVTSDTKGNNAVALGADNALTINGGTVSANATGLSGRALYAFWYFNYNGGTVSANATGSYGRALYAYNRNYTFSWRTPADRITIGAKGLYAPTNKTATFSKTFTDGTNIYTGTLTGSELATLAGKTLYPAVAVTLGEGITAGSGFISSGDNLYAKVGQTVSVDASNVTVPTGYVLSGITVTPTVEVTGSNGTYSFTVPAADVTVNATFELLPVSVTYLDENGQQQTHDALPLLGGGATTLAAGWYVVNSNISYTGTVTLGGTVTLILADGYTMNIGTSESRINGDGIWRIDDQALTIYGQSTGSGALCVYTTGEWNFAIAANPLTINGGHVTADTDGSNAYAIYSDETVTVNSGNVTAHTNEAYASAIMAHAGFIYNGGIVSAIADDTSIGEQGYESPAISSDYDRHYTFNWRNPSDQITIGFTGLSAPDDTYTATFTKAFTDGTNIYSGTLTGTEAISALAGKTLQPVIDWILLNAGTEDDPYMIYNKEQLDLLATRVNDGNNYLNKYFKLGADIVYPHTTEWNDATSTENNYEAIGGYFNEKHCYFKGKFDGNGYTISGIRIYKPNDQYQGLFGQTESANIHDLTLADARITGDWNTGGIVGRFQWSYITRCHVAADVTIRAGKTNSQYFGGITGYSKYAYTIDHCTSAVKISVPSNNTCQDLGAITGYNFNSTLSDNLAIGATIPATTYYTNYHGAICGNNSAGNLVRNYYYNCTVAGVQNATGVGCGGIKDANNNSITADITDNDGAVPGNARTVAGYGTSEEVGWTFIASPLTENTDPATAAVQNIFSASEYDLYRLSPSDTMWQNYKQSGDHYHFNLENGRGYLYATQQQETVKFIGENNAFNMDDIKEVILPKGFNLVGNPFPRAAYIIEKPYYTLNDDGSAVVTETSTNYISPCTGVVVEVEEDGETVTFSTTNPAAQSTGNRGNLNIALTQTVTTRGGSSTATLDNAIVSFNEGSQLGKFYFGEQNANIYLPQDGKEYAIVSAGNVGEIPVNFKAHENGTYTLTVSSTLNSQLSTLNFHYLHLIDNLTGADVDLLQTPEYTFNAKVTDYESRFRLVFSANDVNDNENDNFAFIGSDGQLIINGTGTIQIIDLMGRVIVTKSTEERINTYGMTAGVYVLQLITSKETMIQKIVVK